MAHPTTRVNGMEIILAASLDQCGLSKCQINLIAKEGYFTITSFWFSDIDSFARKLLLTYERGGIKLGHMHVLHLKALLYWLKNLARCRIDLYNEREDFGQYKLKECIAAYKHMNKFKDTKTMAPDKFQPHSLCGWTQFNCNLQNYLASIRGISSVPLSYIIWKEEFSEVAPPGEDGVKELICLAPLSGMPHLEDKSGYIA